MTYYYCVRADWYDFNSLAKKPEVIEIHIEKRSGFDFICLTTTTPCDDWFA